jgi:hypothetical protein
MTAKDKALQLVTEYYNVVKHSDECLNIEGCPNVISCQLSKYACEGWLKYAKDSALIHANAFMNEYKGDGEFWESFKFWDAVIIEINEI